VVLLARTCAELGDRERARTLDEGNLKATLSLADSALHQPRGRDRLRAAGRRCGDGRSQGRTFVPCRGSCPNSGTRPSARSVSRVRTAASAGSMAMRSWPSSTGTATTRTYGNIGRLDLILESEGDTTNRYRVSNVRSSPVPDCALRGPLPQRASAAISSSLAPVEAL